VRRRGGLRSSREDSRRGRGGRDLEKNLNDFLEDGQQTTVMDSNAFLEERQESLHLRQSAIIIRERLDGIHEDLLDQHLLVVRVEVKSERREVSERRGEEGGREVTWTSGEHRSHILFC
jgi:hypothetical protein